MKLAKKLEYWLDIADYDMGTAESMQKNARYLYTVVMCQQALEKILKAFYLKTRGKEAPFTHNLGYLLKLVGLENDLPSEWISLLTELTAYYITGRYPSYKEKVSSLVTKTVATHYLKASKEIYQWLKSRIRS